MRDDVVVVMIQVVSSLGSSGGNLSAEIIGRVIGASIGLLASVKVLQPKPHTAGSC